MRSHKRKSQKEDLKKMPTGYLKRDIKKDISERKSQHASIIRQSLVTHHLADSCHPCHAANKTLLLHEMAALAFRSSTSKDSTIITGSGTNRLGVKLGSMMLHAVTAYHPPHHPGAHGAENCRAQLCI